MKVRTNCWHLAERRRTQFQLLFSVCAAVALITAVSPRPRTLGCYIGDNESPLASGRRENPAGISIHPLEDWKKKKKRTNKWVTAAISAARRRTGPGPGPGKAPGPGTRNRNKIWNSTRNRTRNRNRIRDRGLTSYRTRT